jgi:single-strand DNA-binding protein
MANYNKVILIGNLTREPQLSYLPSQTSVCEFGMAINRAFKKQDGSEGKEICFVDCQMFGKRAEVVNKYFKKGDPIFIEGRLKFDSWQAQDGSKKSKLRVFVENFEFVGSRQESKPKEEPEQSFEEKYNLNDAPPMDDTQIPF